MIHRRRIRQLCHLIALALAVLPASCSRPVSGPLPADAPAATITAEQVTPAPTLEPTNHPDPTLASSPTPAFPGTYEGEPTPHPTPTGYSEENGTTLHTVGAGETLSYIGGIYGCSIEEIVAANDLLNPDSLSQGQELVIPVSPTHKGPSLKLVPDSELVYGPAYVFFDLDQFSAHAGGYLSAYSQDVEGDTLSGPEIVQLVAQRFSVGPRVLLALLEHQSAWVTRAEPDPRTLDNPMGKHGSHAGLYAQLSWAASQLNAGYYGWKLRLRTSTQLADGTRVGFAPDVNPGTVGVQNVLAATSSSPEEWLTKSGPNGFLDTYQRLFGNPFAFTVDPLVPPGLEQPELLLPWEEGHLWFLTSGPHGGWAEWDGMAALDFVSNEEMLGCTPSAQWATAAAPGLVVRSDKGEVLIDLDGDGFEQTGWVLFYMHMHSDGRVSVGRYVQQGERIGHPSCEGGYSNASHLHFARRYNGEWIAAGRDPLPMILSGWVAQDGDAFYEGTLSKDNEIRTACECWEPAINGLVSDN